jgi:alkylated DNA repair dioxygenase AlkB
LPPGFAFEAAFLGETEERFLLDWISGLALAPAAYKQYTARRRIAMLAPVPEALRFLQERVARWARIDTDRFVHALVTEYLPGTPLGWHRDSPEFGELAGLSLAGTARMNLRRYPPRKGAAVLRLELPPRSVYALTGEARWGWQHAIAPTVERRCSITFRTLRAAS